MVAARRVVSAAGCRSTERVCWVVAISVSLLGCWGGGVGVELSQGQQGDSDVAELVQEPVQGGLVGDGSVQDGGAVLERCEGHAVEAVGPVGAEVSLEADLVPGAVAPRAGRLLRHGLSSVRWCPGGR